MIKHEIECGCEMLVYQDGSAPPEVVFCQLHAAAEPMKKALQEIKEGLEGRSREHPCMGFHCSTCAPVEFAGIADSALEKAGG